MPGTQPTVPTNIIAAGIKSMLETKVPASVSIAQWALESGWGVHSPGNNPFGMKPRAGKNDPFQMLMTTEYSRSRGYYKVPQPFRKFDTIADAFDAHTLLLSTTSVYNNAFAALPDVNEFIDKMSLHYATDPLYGNKIKATIKSHNLTQYDIGEPVNEVQPQSAP